MIAICTNNKHRERDDLWLRSKEKWFIGPLCGKMSTKQLF